jgi:hypothetical protein
MVIPVAAGYAEDLKLIERLQDEPADRPADKSGAEANGEPPTPARVAAPTPSAQLRFRETSILGCTFVPLIGEQGYQR